MNTIRWGIIGTGGIARKFTAALHQSRTGRLAAVASRMIEKATAFASEFDIPRAYGSYDELLRDSQVDAVYISLPNHLHAPLSIAAGQHGKHILCEKPISLNEQEATSAYAAAREHKVALVEAFVYRGHPQTQKVRELVGNGTIGKVGFIQACFGLDMTSPEAHGNIRLQAELGGGGILDVGCYCTSYAAMIAADVAKGEAAFAADVQAFGTVSPIHHVDDFATANIEFESGIVASVACALRTRMLPQVTIYGSLGKIHLPGPFWPANKIVLHLYGKDPRELAVEETRNPFAIEADNFAACVLAGKAIEPCITESQSLANMRLLDAWRAGLPAPAIS